MRRAGGGGGGEGEGKKSDFSGCPCTRPRDGRHV